MAETRLVIHVGTSKTGTTSIQGFLNQNSALLAEQGVYFLTTGRKHIAHTPIHRALKSSQAPVIWQEIEGEMREKGAGTHILSSEYFFSAAAAQGFATYMPRALADLTEVVAYIRRQDKYAESIYKQQVKVGRIPPDPVAHFDRVKHTYRYLEQLDAHAAAFSVERVHVRPFERAQLADGDVIQDFLATLGLSSDGWHRDVVASNQSLSREATEIIGALARNTSMNARQIMREMQRSGDPKLMGSDDVYDLETRREMMAYYKDSNDEIQLRFRSKEGCGLFDVSDLEHPTATRAQTPEERLERMAYAHEAALKAIERVHKAKRMQLFK